MDPATSASQATRSSCDDLRTLESSRGRLTVRADLLEALLAAGLGPDDEMRLDRSELVGKRPLESLVVAGQSFVVRRYHHGGLLRWLTGERFSDPSRPLEELHLQRGLARDGVLSPEVVAARAVRARGWGWRLALVTRRVDDAVDLGQALAMKTAGELAPDAWRRLVGEAGRLVSRLHAIGFEHADLTPRNLLVESATLEDAAPRLWVLDLDRSRRWGALPNERRLANLGRLGRHLMRLGRELGLTLGARDVARFLRAYRPERAARHADWRALLGARGGRGARLHALGWWLERRLGRGRSGAESHLGRPSGGGRLR